MDTVPPQVSVLELENKTFFNEVPLSFTVNEKVLKVTYCLDGQDNVSIAEDTKLIGLSSGEHSLTFYATDEAGNVGSSKTINFSVIPFSIILVTASIIIIAVVGIALLVYFKKRKNGTFQNKETSAYSTKTGTQRHHSNNNIHPSDKILSL